MLEPWLGFARSAIKLLAFFSGNYPESNSRNELVCVQSKQTPIWLTVARAIIHSGMVAQFEPQVNTVIYITCSNLA